MSCESYVELISISQDEALDVADRTRLQAHLATCGACRGVEEDFRLQRLLLHAMAREAAPPATWRALRGRLVGADASRSQLEPTRSVPVGGLERARMPRSARRRFARRAVRLGTGLVAGFCGLLLWLGYTDVDPAGAMADPAPAVVVEASSLLREHAMGQSTNPMADRAAWHLLASSTVWGLPGDVSEDEAARPAAGAGRTSPEAEPELL